MAAVAQPPVAQNEVVPAVVKPNPGQVRRFVRQQVPQEILDDPALRAAMDVLPRNYNFEIHKTVWRVKQAGARRVALQFPEGLLMYACTIADILETFAGVEECMVLGDVTYGACCVDDFSAAALGADFLVHYGHSCLVPVDVTAMPCLYVFVDIGIDLETLVSAIQHNFSPSQSMVLAGTIQFAAAIQQAKAALGATFPSLKVPQAKPLSPGEVLGCTAPVLPPGSADVIVFVADGRFHLEAIMIANPTVPAFRYDPYACTLTREIYDQGGMRRARRKAVQQAQAARNWGVVLGTLGRQGNPRILDHVSERLAARGRHFTIFLVSELSPSKAAAVGGSVEAWVQIACPRLSIDWGEAFPKPLLTPYELEVALGFVEPWWQKPGLSNAAPPAAAAAPAGAPGVPGRDARPAAGVGAPELDARPDAGGRSGASDGCLWELCPACGGSLASLSMAGKEGEGQGRQDGKTEGGRRRKEEKEREREGWSAGEGVSAREGFSAREGGSEKEGEREGEEEEGEKVREAGAAEEEEDEEALTPYPMDYYAKEGGVWNSVYVAKQTRRAAPPQKPLEGGG
eukprot:jgi/Mesen1/4108/ME000216S03364